MAHGGNISISRLLASLVDISRIPQATTICTVMTTIRPFRAEDLFKFNHINLDPLTETYNIPFYMQYVATWPSLCASFEDPNGRMMGYILGKAEGNAKLWHGHVTAVTVSPEYRRLGVAKNLMAYLVRIWS